MIFVILVPLVPCSWKFIHIPCLPRFILWLYYNWFTRPTVDGHWGCFGFGVGGDSPCTFWHRHRSLLGLDTGAAGCRVTVLLYFSVNRKSSRLAAAVVPLTVCIREFPALVHPRRHVVLLVFPMVAILTDVLNLTVILVCTSLIYRFIGLLDNLICKVPIQSLVLFATGLSFSY